MTPVIPMHLVDSSRNLISSAIVEIKPTTPSCVPTQKKVTFKIKTPPPILVVVVEALEEGVVNIALEGEDMEIVVEVNIQMIVVIKGHNRFKMNNVLIQIHYQAQIKIQVNYVIKISKFKVPSKLLTQTS